MKPAFYALLTIELSAGNGYVKIMLAHYFLRKRQRNFVVVEIPQLFAQFATGKTSYRIRSWAQVAQLAANSCSGDVCKLRETCKLHEKRRRDHFC
jgi:hypothetical protein